jgi:hypothetical protein
MAILFSSLATLPWHATSTTDAIAAIVVRFKTVFLILVDLKVYGH